MKMETCHMAEHYRERMTLHDPSMTCRYSMLNISETVEDRDIHVVTMEY